MASTPAAPIRKNSATRPDGPSVTFADSIGAQTSMTTTRMTTTTTTASGVVVRPWLRPLALAGLTIVSLIGIFLMVVDFMTPRQKVELVGKDTFLVAKVAAPYLLETSYLSMVALTTLLCGASGLIGLLGDFRILKAVCYVLICLLCLFCGISGFVEIGIGVYGSTKGNMYQNYLRAFQTMRLPDRGGLTNPLDALLIAEWSLTEDPRARAVSRAIEAAALHYWLGFWYTLAAATFWFIGDSLVRLAFVVDGRKAFCATVCRSTRRRGGRGGREENEGIIHRLSVVSNS